LHLGFLDLHGGLGRSFGSLGLAIDALPTVLRIKAAKEIVVEGPDAARAREMLRRFQSRFAGQGNWGLEQGVHVEILESTPPHIGLGSGTQLGLALGTGLSHLFGMDLESPVLAAVADRGQRSGIGIGAFERGGFLVDGGRSEEGLPPPIIIRSEFPESWRLMLIFDHSHQGLHGSAEVSAFRALPPFPEEKVGEICRAVLMQALPGLAEVNWLAFSTAIGHIQQVVGDHFAPAQGGRYTSRAVTEVIEWLVSQGIVGVGQSSWGPTGFGILASVLEADEVLRMARSRFARNRSLSFSICAGRNQGATVQRSINELESGLAQRNG
jgi:beta-RFAP synthase